MPPSPSSRAETIARSRVEQLLETRGGKKVTNVDGGTVFIMPNESVVRLPTGYERMLEGHVAEIADIKCDMSSWEYDYWLTHQDLQFRELKDFSKKVAQPKAKKSSIRPAKPSIKKKRRK